MGFHIYINEVVEKPPYTEEAERQDLVFWPIRDFLETDWEKLELLFADKVAEIFHCEGLFLEDCPHNKFQLPFMRVKTTDRVMFTRLEFAEYMRQEDLSSASQRLLYFFC